MYRYALSQEKFVDVEGRADIDFVDVVYPDSDKKNRVLAFGFPPTHIAYQSLQLGVRPGGEGYRAVLDCARFLTSDLSPNLTDWRECHNTAIDALDGCNNPSGLRDPYPPPEPPQVPEPAMAPAPVPEPAYPPPVVSPPIIPPPAPAPVTVPAPLVPAQGTPGIAPSIAPPAAELPSSPVLNDPASVPLAPVLTPPPFPPPPPPPYSLFPACFPNLDDINATYKLGKLQVHACSEDAVPGSFELCNRVPCATHMDMNVADLSTMAISTAAGLHCIQAVATIDTVAAAYSQGPVSVGLMFLPMCPEPVLFNVEVTVPRAQMKIGTASLDVLNSHVGINLSGSSPNLKLDSSLVESSNVHEIQISSADGFMQLLINITDVSRGANLFIPAHAYQDGQGHPGADNKTISLPPIPMITSRTGESARAIAGVSVAATATSAILSGAAGGASGPGIGRSVANLQFFAWTTGLAVPHLPQSYKDLVNALRWSTIIPSRPTATVNVESVSEPAAGEDNNNSTFVPESSGRGKHEHVQPIVAVQDVYRTLSVVTTILASLSCIHAGMLIDVCMSN